MREREAPVIIYESINGERNGIASREMKSE